MKKEARDNSSEVLVQQVVLGLQEIKGEDIAVIDLRKIQNAVTDYFVICSGNSDTHISSLADSVNHQVKKNSGTTPWQTEGKSNKEWILLDYTSVVVHIFKKDKREFYALEELWGDGIITHIENL